MDFKKIKVFYWSDSSTVLTWINREDNWSIFVANRIKEIRDISEVEQWRHVPGNINPADLPSRGCTVDQLLKSRWWEGPNWLKGNEESWPNSLEQSVNETEVLSELKKTRIQDTIFISLASSDGEDVFCIFSSFSKATKVMGWIRRFVFNCRNSGSRRRKDFLTASECRDAENCLFKIIQSVKFNGVSDEKIKGLLPFMDDDGIFRTKSKISYREDNFDFRYPIILPEKDHLVECLIREKHIDLKHAGVAIMLAILREKFWIVKGRKVVRSVVQKCVDYRRHDAKPIDANTPPLPLNRVRDASIFEVIGVDFAGPIFLRGGKKAWICIFTCAVYRAVHLELVNSLNVPSFLMALRRHIARRGRPSVIYSDNGTNFVGLSNKLNTLNYESIAKTLSIEQIEWKFNPPSAPWWGGFWERLIGVLKRLLRRTLRKTCLNYEEMLTTLIDCEAIINSRPITYISESNEEIVPLSPSMFLQEVKGTDVPDLDRVEGVIMSKRFAYRQKLKQDLRQRFRNEYLGALSYPKRKNWIDKEIRVGDVVLIGSDNSRRIDWPLARVKRLIVGSDGNTRVAKLTTASGEITRPIQRLYHLELNSSFGDENDLENASVGVKKDVRRDLENVEVVDDNGGKQTRTRSGRISKEPRRIDL